MLLTAEMGHESANWPTSKGVRQLFKALLKSFWKKKRPEWSLWSGDDPVVKNISFSSTNTEPQKRNAAAFSPCEEFRDHRKFGDPLQLRDRQSEICWVSGESGTENDDLVEPREWLWLVESTLQATLSPFCTKGSQVAQLMEQGLFQLVLHQCFFDKTRKNKVHFAPQNEKCVHSEQ